MSEEEKKLKLSDKTTKSLKTWAARTGKSVKDLVRLYHKARALMVKSYPNASDADLENAARKQVYVALKSDIRSPSIFFTGQIFGRGDPYDLVSKTRRELYTLFEEHPERALDIGAVMADAETGNVLMDKDGKNPILHDVNENFPSGDPNPRYKKWEKREEINVNFWYPPTRSFPT